MYHDPEDDFLVPGDDDGAEMLGWLIVVALCVVLAFALGVWIGLNIV